MMKNDNNGGFIGAHQQRRPHNEFEAMFNDLQADSYEEEMKRKRAEQQQREAGTNKHAFVDLSSTAKDND